MLQKQIQKVDVTYYEFAIHGPDQGTFIIQRGRNSGWSLWHNGQSNLSLHHPVTAQEVEFDAPEQVVAYCGTAAGNDPTWAYFYERVGKNKFPSEIGDEKLWTCGADMIPRS